MADYKKGLAKEVPIGDFAPDLDWTTPGILLDCHNAMPTVKGDQCLNSAQVFASQIVGSPVIGLFAGKSAIQTAFWAGTANSLYNFQSGNWVFAGGPYNAQSPWQFTLFGTDTIAVAANVQPQVALNLGATFTALGGNPPFGATDVVAINSQIMLTAADTWYVSAIGTDNNWSFTTQVQSAFAPITDLPGNILALGTLYRNAVAFKSNGIWLGTYIGGFQVWSFSMISSWNGTWGPNCIIELPEMIAFLGIDDFYYTTGYTPQRIPNNLKEWFFDTANLSMLASTQAAYDSAHAIVFWFFVSNVATNGLPDQFVCYNLRAQRWTNGYLPINAVFHLLPGGLLHLRYVDQNNVTQILNGPPATMLLKTGYAGQPGKLTQLVRARFKYTIYPQTESLRAYHVNSLGQQDVNDATVMKGADEWHNVRQTDRYHRVELSVNGSTEAPNVNIDTGCEVTSLAYEFREAGDR